MELLAVLKTLGWLAWLRVPWVQAVGGQTPGEGKTYVSLLRYLWLKACEVATTCEERAIRACSVAVAVAPLQVAYIGPLLAWEAAVRHLALGFPVRLSH